MDLQSNVRQIKDGKMLDFGSVSLEKQAILFSSTKLNEAQIKWNVIEDDIFCNYDVFYTPFFLFR